MKKKIFISVAIVIFIMSLLFLCRCNSNKEYVHIPVPDESYVAIDEVTIEQIEERARELESKYQEIGSMKYEDAFLIIIAANFSYLSEEERQKWFDEYAEIYTYDLTPSLNYVGHSYFKWNYLYTANRYDINGNYWAGPMLSEIYFDDDLIAQAEFIEKQIFNCVYEQDDSAVYNLKSYLLSEEHPLATEYAPLHYGGEIMQGCAGYYINNIAMDFLTGAVERYDNVDGYSREQYDYVTPKSTVLFDW